MISIRGRLLVFMLIGLAVVMSLGGTGIFVLARAKLHRQLDETLLARTKSIAALASHEHGQLEFDSSRAADLAGNDLKFCLRFVDGEVIDTVGSELAEQIDASDFTIGEGDVRSTELRGDMRVRMTSYAFEPHSDDDDGTVFISLPTPPPKLELVAALDRAPVDTALGALLIALIVVGVCVAFTSAFIVFAGIHWGLAPLRATGRQLADVDGGSMSQRFEMDDVARELKPVYVELNHMFDRIEGALNRERLFADAAAHELRTPLAELRTTVEVALRMNEPERAQAALDDVLAIGREMEHLVESLLSLSRGREGVLDGQTDQVDLKPLVQSIVDVVATEQAAAASRIDVTMRVDGTIEAQSQMLSMILRNLISNAIQHTAAGGSVAIRTLTHNGMATGIEIENRPVDLAQDDVPRMFDPFWRKDEARSDRLHAGLGLSIVQQLAKTTRLDVSARLHDRTLIMRLSESASDDP